MITQVEIARRVGMDVSSVNKILNRRLGPVFRKDSIKKVFRVARQLGFDFGRLKFQHRRKHPRAEVALSTELTIYGKDGRLYDQGMATIRDISLGGARVTDVVLPLGILPVEPFTVGLRPMQQPADELDLQGHIVRLHTNGTISFGIEFRALEASVERRLRRIARA